MINCISKGLYRNPVISKVDLSVANASKKPVAVIIADEPLLTEAFSLTLEEAGIKTHIFFDGQKGMNRLALIDADILIIDFSLQYITVDNIMRTIQANHKTKKMIILAVTERLQQMACVRDFADFVATKPFSYRHLRMVTNQVCKLYTQNQSNQ